MTQVLEDHVIGIDPDVDVHDVEVRGPKLELNDDLLALKSFFRAARIPFGIVL